MKAYCEIVSNFGCTCSALLRRSIAVAAVLGVAGCGAIGAQLLTSTLVNVAPELLAVTLGQ